MTNQLATPGTAPSVQFVSCSGTTSYQYVYVAVDVSGGTTMQSPANTSVLGCASLSGSSFTIVTIPIVIGPQPSSCVVYRTSPSAELVGSVACGAAPAAILDTGAGATGSPPAVPSTGGVKAAGTVSGQNFVATGSGAGTSDWVAGTALPACASGTGPQPCIQMNSFFIQAPTGPITTFGWTAPSATNTWNGPVIAAANNSGTPPASALSVGYMTNTTINPPTQPTLATVGTGSLPNGDIVKISNAGAGAIDLVDSTISSANVAQLNVAETFTSVQSFSGTPAGVVATGGIKAAGYDDTSIGFLTSSQGPFTGTQTITPMSWSITANKYKLDCEIGITQAASATVAFQLTGPGTPTSYNLLMEGPLGASGGYKEIGFFGSMAWSTSTGPDTSTTASIGVHVKALIQSSSSGTLALQAIGNGTNNITVLANSVCVLTQAS